MAAAVDKALARLRQHLTVGEIVAGTGGVIILGISWFLFGVLAGQTGLWGHELVVVGSAALLLVLLLQNSGRHDFGSNYRVIVTGLCLMLVLLAGVDVVQRLRWAVSGSSFDLGGLTWWVGAIVAAVGGWMVWREAD